MQYAIPICNMDSLEKKLTRIQNKCAKYGCDFQYKRIGEHFEEVTEREQTGVDSFTGQPIYKTWKAQVKFIDIDVEGKAEVNGWRFAATLEYTPHGNIIAGVEGIEIPERYYNCEPWCEHCKTRRDRKNSYIVQNMETGEFKQVGKGCLKDFTHGLSAEAAALCESWFKEAEDASMWGGFGGWPTRYYDVDAFMAVAAEAIRVCGYVRSTDNGVSTRTIADMFYRIENGMRIPFLEEDEWRKEYEAAVERGFDSKRTESVELAKAVRAWILANDRNDNYFHNLKIACSMKCAESSHLGLLVSSFPAYNRELEYQAEKRERERKEAEERANSSYMGNVGDRVAFVCSEYRLITSWETQFGRTYVFKLKDENGLTATWKTSNWVDDSVIGKTVKGTIKELKEFRGVKQTELTRCRIA